MTLITMKSDIKLKQIFSMFLLWLLVISSLTGCDNRAEALELAKTGQITAETMAKYYESLIQDTYETWDYEAFLIGKDRKPGDPIVTPDAVNYTKRIEELNKRVKLARILASTYKALQELSSYDASGEISKSAGELKDSLSGLGDLPGLNVVPTELFKMVIEDLAKWKQSRDIRKGSALISQVLQQLYELFNKESATYKSFVKEKGDQVTILVEYLIDEEKVTSLALLQKVPDSFGLKLVGTDKPVEKGSEIAKALIEMVKVRGERIAQMSAQAADGIKQSIAYLIANHRQLQEKRGLTLSGTLQGLERAKAYIDEINKLRTENK